MSISEKLITVSENMAKVHEAGKKAGKNEEWSKAWDLIQDCGRKVRCSYMFYYCLHLPEAFYPKYDIKPTVADYFMRDTYSSLYDYEPFDLVERLAECGVKMDFSNCTNVTYAFYNSCITHIPVLDCRKGGITQSYLLISGRTITVDKIIIKDDGSQYLSDTFGYANNLENVVIEGVIGANSKGVGFNTKWSKKLSRASIISLINALSDTVTTGTATFSATAVNNAFETAEGLADGSTSTEWNELINTKNNWTISLI